MVAQQLSTKSAAAIWARLEAACGPAVTAPRVLELDEVAFRTIGFSRQKTAYGRAWPRRSLAACSISTRWRPSPRTRRSRRSRPCAASAAGAPRSISCSRSAAPTFSGDDLGLQAGMQKLKRLDTRPNRKAMDQLAEPSWRAARLRRDLPLALLRRGDPGRVSGGTDLRSASLPHRSGASSKTGAHNSAGGSQATVRSSQAAEVLGEPLEHGAFAATRHAEGGLEPPYRIVEQALQRVVVVDGSW